MANKIAYSITDVADALRDTKGIKSVAAKRVGCSVDTIDRYIAKYPTVEQAFKDARAEIVDMAEGQLLRKLSAGEWPAVHFALTTLGKDRGYAQTLDVRHKLEDVARQLAEETGEPFDVVLAEVSDLTAERKKRRAA